MNINEIRNLKKYVEGGSFNNGFLDKLAERYSQQNSSSISSFDIIFSSNRVNELIKDGISFKCVVDYGNLPSKANVKSAQRSFHHEVWTRRNDNIKTGDIVEFSQDPQADFKTFIIMNALETRDQYNLNVMQMAQGTLKWLNSSGVIKETPFTQKSTSSAYPLEEDKIMILSKERRVILIQSNDDTKLVRKDKRFIFDDRCWKVVGFNGLTEGLLELTLEEDQFNEATDNEQLRIAHYFGNVANYKITILNSDNCNVSLDDVLQLNIQVTNNNSPVDFPPLVFTTSDESIATVDGNGLITPLSIGEVIIKIGCNGFTTNFTLRVTERRVYNYTLDIVGNTEININQTKEYQVIFYNNGTPIHDKATFSLTSLTGSPTTLATIRSYTDSTCVIIARKSTGRILLHVTNQNGLITGSKEIKITSLL